MKLLKASIISKGATSYRKTLSGSSLVISPATFFPLWVFSVIKLLVIPSNSSLSVHPSL